MAGSPGAPTNTPLLALLAACAPPPTGPEMDAPPVGPRGAPPVGVVIRSQADADTACTGRGPQDPEHLTITGPGITHLAGLHCMRRVTQGLAIHDAPALATLDGLGGLTDLGGLSLAHLPALADTAGLGSLARVDGDVGIWDIPALPALSLPALLWVGGDVIVQDAHRLEQVDDIRALGGLQGGLRLGGSGVADLSGLDRLGRVLGPVVLTGLDGPAALDGLHRLADVGGLRLSDAPGLVDLDGLSSLRRVRGDVVLEDLPDLRDLSALHALRQVDGRIVLRDLPALPAGGIDALAAALQPHGIGVVVE